MFPYSSHTAACGRRENFLTTEFECHGQPVHCCRRHNSLESEIGSKVFQFQLLCLVHKFYYNNNQLPIIFSNLFTLNTEIHSHNTRSLNNLHLPSVDNSCGTRCVQFNASRLWNNLPKKLKTIQNYNTFKTVKELFTNY